MSCSSGIQLLYVVYLYSLVGGALVMTAGLYDGGGVELGPGEGPVDEGPVDEGPVDEGPVDEGPVDEGPVDEGLVVLEVYSSPIIK